MPTVTIGQRAANTYSGTEDSMLADFDVNTPYPSETGTGGDNPFLLRFTGLSNITGPVTVTDAFITINCISGVAGTDTVEVKRVLQNWVEAQTSWNNYATSTPWGTAGCLLEGTDRVAANSCTVSYDGGFNTGDYASTGNSTLISDVQGWIDNPSTNHGLRLVGVAAEAWGLPANATDGNRPFLTVTYTVDAGPGDHVKARRMLTWQYDR